jgi:hypothetical protein
MQPLVISPDKGSGNEMDLQKAFLSRTNREEWANRFLGFNDLYIDALQLTKDFMALNKEQAEDRKKNIISWRELDELPKSERQAYHKERDKARERYQKRFDALEERRIDLDRKLIDAKLDDAKRFRKSDPPENIDDWMEKAKLPSATTDVTPEKARKILHDGEVHGKPLTDQQRKFFGAIGGHLPAPGSKKSMEKADDGKPGESLGETSTEELKTTLADIDHRLKAKSDDPSLQARRKAIAGELAKRGMKKSEAPVKENFPKRDLGGWLEKAKYLKRTGMPGHYKYEYPEEKKAPSPAAPEQGKDEKKPQAAKEAETKQTKPLGPHDVKVGMKVSSTQEIIKISPSGKQITIGSSGGGPDIGSKFGGRTFTFRWDGTGFKRQGEYVMPDGIYKPKMEKSMSAETLDEWIEKAYQPNAMPTHESRMGGPKSDSLGGSQDGGEVEGKGKTPDNNGGTVSAPGVDAQGKVAGVPGAKSEKLSEDDEEEGEIGSGKKPIEKLSKSELSTEPLTPARQRDMVAREVAVESSRLRKGSEMVHIGPSAHPLSVAQTMTADLDALSKSGDQTDIPSMMVSPGQSIAQSQVLCKSVHEGGCDDMYSAMLTACPGCGAGTVVSRVMPLRSRVAVVPVADKSGLRPAKRDPMITIKD